MRVSAQYDHEQFDVVFGGPAGLEMSLCPRPLTAKCARGYLDQSAPLIAGGMGYQLHAIFAPADPSEPNDSLTSSSATRLGLEMSL